MSSSGASAFDEVGRTEFQSLLREACAATLPEWLETRRWFADKGRGIVTVGIEDALFEPVGSDWLALAVARVSFSDGNAARYFLPLTLTQAPGDADMVIASAPGANAGVVVDATETPWFGGWLLGQLAGPRDPSRGAWDFAAPSAAAPEIAAARNLPASVTRAEQSNTSIRFGDVLMVKLFRRLLPGSNPDEEVLRALARAGFARAPRYAGSVSWRSDEGETFAVALAQGFVPNIGDGWWWMLQRLEGVAAGDVDPGADDFTVERLLGRRTGELHVALGGVGEPAFAPEAADRATIEADARRTRAAIDETIGLLQVQLQVHLPETIRARMPDAIEGLRALSGRTDGYQDEGATRRIRVHGDYHLGQALRTPDGDWTIIDFEGEPARSLDERRQRSSALKDVAGMLRSFAYARGAAERASGVVDDRAARARLLVWETGARREFLAGYRQALAAAPVVLAPAEDAAFARALAAWELDKTLYEVAYEARNRPGWIEIPLRALLPHLLDQPVDATGSAPA